ncbi:helix-turn-helix transcriptional regulator [Streptomyces sp. NPDC002082]|uniref:helix-turn-helix domain-containing protein n=1 Tax=Streptomyces sp. NPDC002082 TaxID=3154772 RepID=UPI00332E7B2F
MGRPELPVDFTVPARGKLAKGLRELRNTAGLTYAELAVKTGVSPATLKRAASGRTVPSWETVTAIAAVCGDLDGVDGLVVHLWQMARIVERDRLSQLRKPGSPELVTTRGALSEALEYFYERAGALPLRRLRALAGGAHLLPVSSAARIVNREALPASRQQCAAFLTACGVGPRLVERWAEAFERIVESRETDAQRQSDVEAMLALTLGGRSRRTAERYWAERRPVLGRMPPSRFTPGEDAATLFDWPDDQDLRAA